MQFWFIIEWKPTVITQEKYSNTPEILKVQEI